MNEKFIPLYRISPGIIHKNWCIWTINLEFEIVQQDDGRSLMGAFGEPEITL
jgi:hypothetical protein